MLILNQENDQHALRAPWMTTRHRYTPENNNHKDKNKNKVTSLSPLNSQLIQKLRSLHCDSCLVTELDQGKTGALAVYGLPEGLLKNDSGRIKVTPDLNDEWVHLNPAGGRGGEPRQHEKMIKNDFNEVLNWNYDISSKDDDRDKTDDTRPFVTVVNQNGVGCAYDDDSIAGSIGDTSILRPDSDFSNSNVNISGELEKCTTITTPFFQDFSPSLLPPPTPRPRPMELSDTDSEDHSLPLLPPSPTSQHKMVLFSSDWEMEKTQYYSLNMDLYKQQAPDRVVSVLFEPTSSPPFAPFIPSVEDEEIGIPYPVYKDSLDNIPKHWDLLGLEGPRPRTAHGRQEVNPSSDYLAVSLRKTDTRNEPPPAPRLGVLSDDFGDEEEESESETNYDSDTVYLFNPFNSQQQDSFSNSSWGSNPTDSTDDFTMKPSPPEENLSCSKSYPSPPPSPNPLFPPGLTLEPPKKTKSPTKQSSYALSEKSQWKLSVTRYQRSLSTRGMRHPGFPPSPLGPNWEIYHARV